MTRANGTALPVDDGFGFVGDAPPAGHPEPVPAANIPAERELISILMTSEAACAAVAELLWPEDFWRPAHQVTYRAIQVMRAAGTPVDAITLADWITRDGDMQALGGETRGRAELVALYGIAGPWVLAGRLAEIIRDKAISRRLDESLVRSRQLLRQGDSDMPGLVGRITAELEDAAAHLAANADPLDQVTTARAFTTAHRIRMPPVIDGLVHKMDRVVIIGPEGHGKSLLLDQFGVCAAAGLHPFTHTPIAPARVLIVDLENPRDLVQDRLAHMLSIVEQMPGWSDDRLHVLAVPEGLELAQPGDAFRVSQAIKAARPDLVVAGPIAKMFDDTGERSDHTKVAKFWDRARIRGGFAVVLEHHPPAAQNIRRAWRPAGSNRWASSPEVGLSLIPDGSKDAPAGALRVQPYRGHRRPGMCWPIALERNLMGGWPWSAKYAAGTFDTPLTGSK